MTEGDDFHLYTKLNIDKAGNVSEEEKFYETVKRKSQRQGFDFFWSRAGTENTEKY